MENTIPVQSVKKALDLLDQVIMQDLAGDRCSLGELARQMQMPGNSAHNLLKTLAACGYVQQVGRGVYQPGAKLRQIGVMNRLQLPAVEQAVAHGLKSYVEQQGEACLLAMLVDGQRVTVSHLDSNQAIRVSHERIEQDRFFQLPTGRMLAAMADEDELERIITRQGMPGRHWDEISSRPVLIRRLKQLKKRGWCELRDQNDELVSLACPVTDTDSSCRAVVGSYAPLFRCGQAKRIEMRRALKTLAADLSDKLNSPPLSAAANGNGR